MAAAGFGLTDQPGAADVVVVSFDRTFDYAKLLAAYRAVRLHGARLVATNPDPYCPTPDGGLPDCAAMLAAVEACTGATAEAIVGKPSRQMAAAVLDRLGTGAAGAAGAAMVGDRLATDMAMARGAGMTGVLVLTGATSPKLRPIRQASSGLSWPFTGCGRVVFWLLQGERDRGAE
jgi:ribonucleotide monophosphatase NagD (HAD superfamily)